MPMVKTNNAPEAERGQIFQGLRQTIHKLEGGCELIGEYDIEVQNCQ